MDKYIDKKSYFQRPEEEIKKIHIALKNPSENQALLDALGISENSIKPPLDARANSLIHSVDAISHFNEID